MVTRLFSATARQAGYAAGGSGTLLALLSVMTWGALAMPACEKVPLTAPSGTDIILVASTNVLPINGSADLTAVLIENGTGDSTGAAGTPVHNGTLVTFTTSLGRIEPAEARTTNGRVTVKLIADGRSGVATIVAFSGGNASTIDVTIGAAATASVTVWATPATIPASGGTVSVSARVADGSGNPLFGVPVSFTTTAGTLTPSSATTNQEGTTTVSLTTNADATVAAIAGGRSSTTTVRLRSRSSITLQSPSSTVLVGAPATFSVTPSGTVAFSNVVIDFGDGRSRSLGAISSATPVVYFYESDGVFDVTVRGTDVDGGVAEASGGVAVVPWQFAASGTTSGAVNTIFSFSVTGIPATVPIDHFRWEFGDGTSQDTNSLSISHAYASGGVKSVTVTVFPLYGEPKSASLQVLVTTTTPD